MRGPPSPEAQRDNGAESPGSDAGGDGGDDAAGLGLSEEASGNFKAGGFANETSTPTGGTSASDWESSSGTGTEGGPPSAPATPGRADAEPPLPDDVSTSNSSSRSWSAALSALAQASAAQGRPEAEPVGEDSSSRSVNVSPS